jgi:hypothetical protein
VKCRGIDYTIQLDQETLKLKSTLPVKLKEIAIRVEDVKSLELLTKSVIPPFVISILSGSAYLIYRYPMSTILSTGTAVVKQSIEWGSVMIASLALLIALERILFANIRVTYNSHTILIRLVSRHSGRSFVETFGKLASRSMAHREK